MTASSWVGRIVSLVTGLKPITELGVFRKSYNEAVSQGTKSSALSPEAAELLLQAQHAIRQIYDGGSTNLSGGWLEGHRQVGQSIVQGTNRVLLLTDGRPTQASPIPTALRGMAGGAASNGVSTSCIGFGPGFNEDLLRAMSESGGGHFWYVEALDQMTGAFEGEIEGLVSLAAQNLVLEVTLTHPGVAGVSLIPDVPAERTAEGAWRIRLGDLYAGSAPVTRRHLPRRERDSAGRRGAGPGPAPGRPHQARGHRAPEHRPAGDGDTRWAGSRGARSGDQLPPLRRGQAREEAIRQADQGQFEQAANTLREAATSFGSCEGAPELCETRDDLVAEADRLSQRIYRSEDRKYNMARSAMVLDGRVNLEEKFSRRRGKR
jgi:hypothetical protein